MGHDSHKDFSTSSFRLGVKAYEALLEWRARVARRPTNATLRLIRPDDWRDYGLSRQAMEELVREGFLRPASRVTSDQGLGGRGGQTDFFTLTERPLFDPSTTPPKDSTTKRPASSLDSTSASSIDGEPRPTWLNRELWYDGALVRPVSKRAPLVELLLDAFQEERWETRIANPFGDEGDVSKENRLQSALKRLKRSLRHDRIYFGGDGTGNGACWWRLSKS